MENLKIKMRIFVMLTLLCGSGIACSNDRKKGACKVSTYCYNDYAEDACQGSLYTFYADKTCESLGLGTAGGTSGGQTCTSSAPYTGDAQANSYCGLACQYYANSTQTSQIINLRYDTCKLLSNYLQGFGDVNYAANTKKCKGACANYPGTSP